METYHVNRIVRSRPVVIVEKIRPGAIRQPRVDLTEPAVVSVEQENTGAIHNVDDYVEPRTVPPIYNPTFMTPEQEDRLYHFLTRELFNGLVVDGASHGTEEPERDSEGVCISAVESSDGDSNRIRAVGHGSDQLLIE